MNTLEIDQSLDEIQTYLGAEVQSVSFARDILILGLFHKLKSQTAHLIFVAKPPKSALVLTHEPLKKIKSETKPLYLFAKAHLLGAQLVAAHRNEALGRVVHLDFIRTTEEGKDLELNLEHSLVPIAWNLSLSMGAKRVSLNKPKELPKLSQAVLGQSTQDLQGHTGSQDASKPPNPGVPSHLTSRLDRIKNETLAAIMGSKTPKSHSLKLPPLAKEIEKKQKLLHKLTEDEDHKRSLQYEEFAELVVIDTPQAAQKFPHFYDGSQNTYVQQKWAYEQHKKNQQKIERLLGRQEEVRAEIQTLQALSPEEWAQRFLHQHSLRLQTSKARKSKNSSIDTRKLELDSDCVVYLGKSARDNLALLRQAKAWHYWMHIKDHPSAYALLQCPKTKTLTYNEMLIIVRWWHETSAGFAKSFQEGDKVSILVTQCRYVRPIKGDKLGRVTYSHEQVFTISL